jgi:hypothetical protein
MPTEYAEDGGLTRLLKDVLDNTQYRALAPLRESGLVVLSVFKIKTNKEGETVRASKRPAKAARFSPLIQVFVPAHILVIVDRFAWENFPESRDAMLCSALLDVAIENTEDGLKVGRREPEIMEHPEVIEMFGLYSTPLKELKPVLEAYEKSGEFMVNSVKRDTQLISRANPPAAVGG